MKSRLSIWGGYSLNPSTDWSLSWLVHEAKPLLSLNYLGAAFQEFAYQLLAPSNLGSRLSSLLGALLTASLVLGWLTSRGTPRWPAFAVSLMFLLDPIFNVSYMQGRVDSWAIAICIAACWLLCHACHRFDNQRGVHWPVFMAGVLVSVSVFVWPTALALIPLATSGINLSVTGRLEGRTGWPCSTDNDRFNLVFRWRSLFDRVATDTCCAELGVGLYRPAVRHPNSECGLGYSDVHHRHVRHT